MEWLADMVHYIWSFVVILSAIVFVHEFGHFIVARVFGVRVETFSIGFGREIFGFTSRTGTRWKFSLFPLGGYVKMFGDAGAASTPDNQNLSAMSDAEKKVSFHFKPLYAKACIVIAGPMANFLLTVAIFTYFIFSNGLVSTKPIVGGVLPDSPAYHAQLEPGDLIVSVNGKSISTFNDIVSEVGINVGGPITLVIQRSDRRLTKTIIPLVRNELDAFGNPAKRPVLGIRSETITYDDVGFISAIGHAVGKTYDMCVTTIHVIGQMIRGERSTEELKGPLGIAKLSGDVTHAGDTTAQTLAMMLWFIAMLSANLGFVNLFPIPMLDGGHLMYYSIEALRGKPMAERVQDYGFRVGFAVLACLMAFTIFNDVKQILF
jgi:regulator of sigma E protease